VGDINEDIGSGGVAGGMWQSSVDVVIKEAAAGSYQVRSEGNSAMTRFRCLPPESAVGLIVALAAFHFPAHSCTLRNRWTAGKHIGHYKKYPERFSICL
jgi:hypothetical protein